MGRSKLHTRVCALLHPYRPMCHQSRSSLDFAEQAARVPALLLVISERPIPAQGTINLWFQTLQPREFQHFRDLIFREIGSIQWIYNGVMQVAGWDIRRMRDKHHAITSGQPDASASPRPQTTESTEKPAALGLRYPVTNRRSPGLIATCFSTRLRQPSGTAIDKPSMVKRSSSFVSSVIWRSIWPISSIRKIA